MVDPSKYMRATAATMRGIAVVGVVAAVIIALFAMLGTKLMAAAVMSVAGAAWWGVCAGLAWVLHRKADEMQREADSRERLRPRDMARDSQRGPARR
jgi:hypothetical protein